MIDVLIQENIAIASLNRSRTNALNTALLNELQTTLSYFSADDNIRALVLTSSSDRFFSIGLDVPEVFDLSQSDFESFYRLFTQVCLDLFIFHKPVIAAIPGHATAGGCILALCCDYRYISQGKAVMGLNEIKLGVPVPYLADYILHSIVGTKDARSLMESGNFLPVEELARFGLVDEVINPPSELLKRAMEKAKEFCSYSPTAYTAIKYNRTNPIITRYTQTREEEVKLFVQCWYSDTARHVLKEIINKF
ncbi:MAG: enoyl-CoA hydratase/isomerase family protein [Candidatus Heimdallarchaeota archaeon]|nr:enoyl-CoA hydratase/isomerase family protein [Candidatus Heimdallarchaeota archaeon]